MIYLLYGTDTLKSREKSRALLNNIFAKKPNASYIRIDKENFDESEVEELIGGQGLFENKYIIVFDGLFSDKDIKEILLKNIKEISTSRNIFIFIEEKLNKIEIKKFEKYAEKIQELNETIIKKKFNIFTLTDALGRRDKKGFWVLYQKAKLNNVSDEEVHGILFWQIKNMLLSFDAKDAEAAGLNDFVFRKSLGFTKNYSYNELKKLLRELVFLYHDARKGIHKIDIALERFILGI